MNPIPDHQKLGLVDRDRFEQVRISNYFTERTINYKGEISYQIYFHFREVRRSCIGIFNDYYVPFFTTKSRLEAELFITRVKSTKWTDRYKDRDVRIVMRAK